MTREAVIDAYCQAIGRAMELPEGRKQELLDGFRQELVERFSAQAELTEETLCRTAGTPREAAELLMEGVPLEERDRYRCQKRRRNQALVAGLAAALLLLIGLVIHMWSNNGLVVIETTHYVDGVLPEDAPKNGESRTTYHYED